MCSILAIATVSIVESEMSLHTGQEKINREQIIIAKVTPERANKDHRHHVGYIRQSKEYRFGISTKLNLIEYNGYYVIPYLIVAGDDRGLYSPVVLLVYYSWLQ